MELLKCLRNADERAEDLLLDEDGFSEDLKELVENVSLEMLEEIVASRLGDLLLPDTITRLKAKKTGRVASVTIEQLEQEGFAEEDPKKSWRFWDRMKTAVVRAIKELSDKKPGVEPRSEQKPGLALTQEFKPKPEIGIESEQDGMEFPDAYSALRAVERTVNDIHIRLLARGEGPTEKGVVRLVAEAMRIIGCARELGANEDADEIEQKLNRILAKF